MNMNDLLVATGANTLINLGETDDTDIYFLNIVIIGVRLMQTEVGNVHRSVTFCIENACGMN